MFYHITYNCKVHVSILLYLNKVSKRRKREKLKKQILEQLIQEHSLSAPDPKYLRSQTPKPTPETGPTGTSPTLQLSGIDTSYQPMGPSGEVEMQDRPSEESASGPDVSEQELIESDENRPAPYLVSVCVCVCVCVCV